MAVSIIPLAVASRMTGRFRTDFPDETLAVYCDAAVFTDILSQKDCVGLRIYNALDTDGNILNVLVDIDENGVDLYQGKVYDLAKLRPSHSSAQNPLNF